MARFDYTGFAEGLSRGFAQGYGIARDINETREIMRQREEKRQGQLEMAKVGQQIQAASGELIQARAELEKAEADRVGGTGTEEQVLAAEKRVAYLIPTTIDKIQQIVGPHTMSPWPNMREAARQTFGGAEEQAVRLSKENMNITNRLAADERAKAERAMTVSEGEKNREARLAAAHIAHDPTPLTAVELLTAKQELKSAVEAYLEIPGNTEEMANETLFDGNPDGVENLLGPDRRYSADVQTKIAAYKKDIAQLEERQAEGKPVSKQLAIAKRRMSALRNEAEALQDLRLAEAERFAGMGTGEILAAKLGDRIRTITQLISAAGEPLETRGAGQYTPEGRSFTPTHKPADPRSLLNRPAVGEER